MPGGTQGCSRGGIRVPKLAHKCGRSCWWGAGRWHAARTSFQQPREEGQAEGKRLLRVPARWGWSIGRALWPRPRGAPGPSPRRLSGGPGPAGGHHPAPRGVSGLTGCHSSRRCCRTAPRPAGKWSCTGGRRSARTSSASWTSTRTSTRGGSVCSSSWSGESPAGGLPGPERGWGAAKGGWASSGTGDTGGWSCGDASPGTAGVGETGTRPGLRWL